jgi:transcription elongation GreA/GreB family factor
MRVPTDLHQHLASQDYDALEEAWLGLVAERPFEIDLFVSTADALERAQQADRARTLLEVLDDALVGAEQWGVRLLLLQRSGRRYVRTGRMHETVIETVQQTYAHRAGELQAAMAIVGLDKGRDETPKLWDKVERLRNLLTYEVGTVVAMAGKGVGRVVEVNVQLQTLKVDFQQHSGIAVGFRAAGKTLEVLAEDHILRRKLEGAGQLAALKPPELLREILVSYGRPLAASEVRDAVAGLVPAERWSSWWTAARKHPQILSEGTGARQTYRLFEQGDAAELLWQQFEHADTETQLELLRRSGNQDAKLRTTMGDALAKSAAELRAADPARTFEIWVALERLGLTPSWDVGAMVVELADPDAFLERLSSRQLRERAYELLRLRDDWVELFARRATAENDPRTIDRLADALREDASEAYERLLDRILAQPNRSGEAFAWLVERSVTDSDLQRSRGARIFKQLLYGLADAALAPVKPRLSLQVESGGAAPRLLDVLSEEEARDIWAVLEKARGLEEYQGRLLRNAMRLRFPSLDEDNRDQPLYTTSRALAAKRDELRKLLEEEIPANRRAIEEARAMGDLRENFEYKAARQRHEYLSARASNLSGELSQAQVLDPSTIDPSEMRIGTKTLLRRGDEKRELAILGPWESDPDRGIISYQSELAQTLLGRRPGDEVQIGEETWQVAKIERWSPA